MEYNKGAITRPAFEAGNFGRVHNVLWLLRQVLSADSVLLCAWADAQSAQWIPRVDDIRRTFGWDDKQWRRVRVQLESIGVITSAHERSLTSQKSVHTLAIDLTALLALVVNLELEPPARTGGSHARIAKNGGSRESPEVAGSRESPEVEGLTTTNGPEQNNHNHAPPGAGSREGQQVRSALSPAGEGLGTRLADLLTEPEQRRANAASVGATSEQLVAAEAAMRATVAAGKARSRGGLAVKLAQAAASGDVTAPSTHAQQDAPRASSVSAAVDPWAKRAALSGRYVDHPHGVLIVEPGGRSMRHCGGKHVGSVIAGIDVLSIWTRVESGDLPAPTVQLPLLATRSA